jgi:hypothetical protein
MLLFAATPYYSMYASAPPADWEGAHAPLLQARAVNSSQQQQQQQQPPQQPTAVTVQPVVGVPVATRLFGEDAAFKYPQHPALDAGIKRGAWKDGACSCTKQCYPSCLSSTFCWGWFAIAPLVRALLIINILSSTASFDCHPLCRSLIARALCLFTERNRITAAQHAYITHAYITHAYITHVLSFTLLNTRTG